MQLRGDIAEVGVAVGVGEAVAVGVAMAVVVGVSPGARSCRTSGSRKLVLSDLAGSVCAPALKSHRPAMTPTTRSATAAFRRRGAMIEVGLLCILVTR